MSELKYSKTLKKQVLLGAVAIVILLGIVYGLEPIDSITKISILVVLGLAILFIVVPLINKQANIHCPHCNVELYEVIAATKFQKLAVKFCPCCGGNIEI